MRTPEVTILDCNEDQQYAIFRIIGAPNDQALIECARNNASIAGLGFDEGFVAEIANLTPDAPTEKAVYVVAIRRRRPGDDGMPGTAPGDDTAMNVPRYH